MGDFDEASKNESKVGDCKHEHAAHEHENEHGQNFHQEGGDMDTKLAAA